MKTKREQVIAVLRAARGDDLERARLAFSAFSEDEMREPYGMSDLTRREILQGYEDERARLDALIAWVEEI